MRHFPGTEIKTHIEISRYVHLTAPASYTHGDVRDVPLHEVGKLEEQQTALAGVHLSPWRPQLERRHGRCHSLVYVSLGKCKMS